MMIGGDEPRKLSDKIRRKFIEIARVPLLTGTDYRQVVQLGDRLEE